MCLCFWVLCRFISVMCFTCRRFEFKICSLQDCMKVNVMKGGLKLSDCCGCMSLSLYLGNAENLNVSKWWFCFYREENYSHQCENMPALLIKSWINFHSVSIATQHFDYCLMCRINKSLKDNLFDNRKWVKKSQTVQLSARDLQLNFI